MMRERFQIKEWWKEAKKVAVLKPISDRLETSQPRLVRALVLKSPNVASAITGASGPEQVCDSIRSLELLLKLTPDVTKEGNDTVP